MGPILSSGAELIELCFAKPKERELRLEARTIFSRWAINLNYQLALLASELMRTPRVVLSWSCVAKLRKAIKVEPLDSL